MRWSCPYPRIRNSPIALVTLAAPTLALAHAASAHTAGRHHQRASVGSSIPHRIKGACAVSAAVQDHAANSSLGLERCTLQCRRGLCAVESKLPRWSALEFQRVHARASVDRPSDACKGLCGGVNPWPVIWERPVALVLRAFEPDRIFTPGRGTSVYFQNILHVIGAVRTQLVARLAQLNSHRASTSTCA